MLGVGVCYNPRTDVCNRSCKVERCVGLRDNRGITVTNTRLTEHMYIINTVPDPVRRLDCMHVACSI